MPTTTTNIENIEILSPAQKALLRNLASQLSPDLMQQLFARLQGPEYQTGLKTLLEATEPLSEEALRERFGRTIAEPAQQRFTEEFIPQLQERFTAMGGGAGSQERLGLRTGAERLSAELARQQESYIDTARQRQLQAASMIPGYVSAPAQTTLPYYQTVLGTQAYQPIARQKTRQSAWESFLAGAGQAVPELAKAAAMFLI